MIPDPMEKECHIPVRIRTNGAVEFYYGGPLPAMKHDCIGVLRVPEYAMQDSVHLLALQSEASREILPSDSRLRVLLSCPPDGEKSHRLTDDMRFAIARAASFTGITLLSPLRVRLSLQRRASLEPCQVWLDAINETVGSLNQALTVLSQVLEPRRVSRGGNAFRRVVVPRRATEERTVWLSLDQLRGSAEAEHEEHWIEELKKNNVPVRC